MSLRVIQIWAHILALSFLAVWTKASHLHTRNLDFLVTKRKITIPSLHVGCDVLNLKTKQLKSRSFELRSSKIWVLISLVIQSWQVIQLSLSFLRLRMGIILAS